MGKDNCFESRQDRISNSLKNKLTSSKVVNKLQVSDRNLDNLTGYDLIALLEWYKYKLSRAFNSNIVHIVN